MTEQNIIEEIKISWTGETRQRICALNLDMDGDKSDLVHATLDRQKTNIVIKTADEAAAIAYELGQFRSEGRKDGRTWMNGAAAKACGDRADAIVEAMKERGYTAVRCFGRVRGFEQ